MSRLSRRALLAGGGAGLASAALGGVAPRGLAGAEEAVAAEASAVDKQLVGGLFPPERIGLQLYSISDQISSRGFARTLEEVAKIGFKCVEFAGYTQGTSPEISLEELRKLLDANGLKAVGSHVEPSSVESMKRIIDQAGTLGIPNVGISFPLPSTGPTAFGWRQLAAEYNRYGEMAAEEGIGFYLHNHFHEWLPCVDDLSRRGEDVLLEETDPRYVSFEMDVYWAYVGQWQSGTILKFDPLHDYAIKHRDRYRLFHVKDGRKDLLGGYTDALLNLVDVGQGSIDFQHFFTTLFAQSPDEAQKHWYLWERDTAGQHPRGSMASARASFTYMRYGLTGPNAPRTRVPAIVADVAGKRRKDGRRYVRVIVEATEEVRVTTRARSGKRTLARKAHGKVAAGRHVLELRLPPKAPAGRARLEILLAPTDGSASRTVRLPVVVPRAEA